MIVGLPNEFGDHIGNEKRKNYRSKHGKITTRTAQSFIFA
jgi:hypothetical protein